MNAYEVKEKSNFNERHWVDDVDDGALGLMNFELSRCLGPEEATRSDVPKKRHKYWVYYV